MQPTSASRSIVKLEERTARLTILVDPRKKAVFERLCAEEDSTPSQVVRRLMRAYEALGHCFVEKGQLPVAATILQRALAAPGIGAESLIGVLYLLGAIAEELQLFADAKRYYQRVFAVDIRFRDVSDRLNTVEQRLK